MFATLIIACVLPAFIFAQLQIIPCPGLGSSAPSALRIQGCDSMPCHLEHDQGYDFVYEVDFSAHLPSQTLTLRAFQTAFGVETELGLSEPVRNACNGLIGASCPVLAHQALTHSALIGVEGDLHDGIPVRVRLEIDDDDHICMCTLVDLIVH